MSAAIVNDIVLHQALGNERDPCSATLLAKSEHQAVLSTTELYHSRVSTSNWRSLEVTEWLDRGVNTGWIDEEKGWSCVRRIVFRK